jgi:hypothetical protein
MGLSIYETDYWYDMTYSASSVDSMHPRHRTILEAVDYGTDEVHR